MDWDFLLSSGLVIALAIVGVIAILRYLNNYCKHQWTIVDTMKTQHFGWIKHTTILSCTVCGRIRKVTIRH